LSNIDSQNGLLCTLVLLGLAVVVEVVVKVVGVVAVAVEYSATEMKEHR
jgi:hypothetical protein